MANRSPTIIDRADEVDTDLVPEPWQRRDDKSDRALVAERERYRLQGVTDGQGAGIVPSYALNVADTEAIPLVVQDNWTRGSAGRVLGPNGKYVSRGSDVPRLSYDGEDPGLLVEAAGRTNKVLNSASIPNNWKEAKGSISAVTSAFQGGNAGEVTDGRIEENAGTTSGGQETFSVIIEKGSSNLTDFAWKDTSSSASDEFRYSYDWSNDTLTQTLANDATERYRGFRTLEATGPNGGQLVRVVVGLNADNVGSPLLFRFWGDPVGNGNTTVLHHAQIEEAPNASSPIVTQGSPVTRAPGKYVISLGDWWNTDEGTIFAEFVPQYYNLTTGFEIDNLIRKGGSTSAAWLQLTGNNPFGVKSNSFTGSSLKLSNEATPFESVKAATSVNRSGSYVISVNGVSKSDIADGSNLLGQQGDILDLNQQDYIGTFLLILYFPRALPESTLNAITS